MMSDTKKVEPGTVYLVGAGPGDPELITVKGKYLLRRCDAVIFDNLVPAELIATLPYHIEKFYVGKKAGKYSLPQAEINSLLVAIAREGKDVVRLKGGDPFTFGRGGEEAKYLHKNGIRFEIVPGITAGAAAPAYGGIPCTDRNKASFVTFATGHKAVDKEVSSVPWDLLAKTRNGTIVIYMGVSEFDNIVNTLIENGLPSHTPAAVIERGTMPTQRVISSPLHQLPEKAKNENIKPPAIFIIGDVVDLQKDLSWFYYKPLSGKRVMVTRPADQAKDIYRSLRELGAEVMPYPTIATEKYIDSQAWDNFTEIKYQSDNIDNWMLFTSENGVRYFIEQFISRFGDIRRLTGFKIAAVGLGTARALQSFNLKADFIPDKATTKDLARELVDSTRLEGATVVRVRGNLANDTVEKAITEAKANVLPLQIYRTFYPSWPDGFKDRLFENLPDVIIFSSGSTVEGLCRMLNKDEINKLVSKTLTVSIGPSTSRIIISHGIDVSLEAKEHSIPGIIKELLAHFKTEH